MTAFDARLLQGRIEILVPTGTALLAVVLDGLPLPGAGPASLPSLATLCVVYFWSVHRPDLLTPIAAFLIGVAYDGLAGLPLGSTSLVLLLVRHVIVRQQRFFVARPFPVIWCCFVLLASAAVVLQWLLACLWWTRLFALPPPGFELLLTIGLYPPVSWALGHIHNRIPSVAGTA